MSSKLSTQQTFDLRTMAALSEPVWPGLPPKAVNADVDPDLAKLIDQGLIKWVGAGYRVTGKGKRVAEAGAPNEHNFEEWVGSKWQILPPR